MATGCHHGWPPVETPDETKNGPVWPRAHELAWVVCGRGGGMAYGGEGDGERRGACGKVPFWHSLAKLKPVWRETFCKASLRASFWWKRVRRVTLSLASLRAMVAKDAISRRSWLVTCANWHSRPPLVAIMGHFAQVSAGNVCELALQARHMRKEAFQNNFSLREFLVETCAERNCRKNFSPRRFRLRQAVPKRNPPTLMAPHPARGPVSR